jgi:acetyl esterase/lipase
VPTATFLVFAALSVLNTVNTLRSPATDRPWWARPPWFPTLFASELAPLRLVVQVGVTAAYLAARGGRTPLGRLAVGLMAAAVLGTGAVVGMAARAGAAAEAALSASSGPGAASVRPRHGSRSSRPHWLQTMTGWPFRIPAGVRRIENVPYTAGYTLDVYLPDATTTTLRPAVLYVHGGSWSNGDKRRSGRPLIHHLAETGLVAVVPNYPLSPKATFPAHLIALKRALAWMRSHGPEFGIDPGAIAVAGGSSGAHLAALLALTPGQPRYQPGFEGDDTSVQAAAVFYGVFDLLNRNRTRDDWPLIPRDLMKRHPSEDPAAFRLASPLDQVGPQAPPFLVVHGARDSLVPSAESVQFAEALRSGSTREVVYLEVAGATHGFDSVASFRTRSVVRGVGRFLEWALSG